MVHNWRKFSQPDEIVRILEEAVGEAGRLWVAVTYRDAKVVRELLAKGADPFYRDETTELTVLRQAALRGDVQILEALADAGALAAELATDSGRGALGSAIVRGNKAAVTYLVEHGADPTLPDERGQTPLMRAIEADKSAIAIWLVRRSGDLDATGPEGQTALHLACRGNKLGVARSLLEAGASREIKDRSGAKPADLATDERLLELLRD